MVDMSKNILILDLETKRSFEEVGGYNNLAALGVSVVGVYSYRSDEYQSFWEADFAKLDALLAEKPLLVGFNQRKFDVPVLQPWVKTDLQQLPILDVMEELQKVLGHRVSLDSVAQATFGTKKSGHGLDAIRYWRTGELDKLQRYCLDDVRITKEVYEYGAKNKELFYTSKYGNDRLAAKIDWEVRHPSEQKQEGQLGLF